MERSTDVRQRQVSGPVGSQLAVDGIPLCPQLPVRHRPVSGARIAEVQLTHHRLLPTGPNAVDVGRFW